MLHQLFDNLGYHHGTFVDHADGSTTVLDSMGVPALHHHGTGAGGYFTNHLGVVMDTYHPTTVGVQHLDQVGAFAFREQMAGGKLNLIDSMNHSFASFDPMSHSVTTALGSLQLRLR